MLLLLLFDNSGYSTTPLMVNLLHAAGPLEFTLTRAHCNWLFCKLIGEPRFWVQGTSHTKHSWVSQRECGYIWLLAGTMILPMCLPTLITFTVAHLVPIFRPLHAYKCSTTHCEGFLKCFYSLQSNTTSCTSCTGLIGYVGGLARCVAEPLHKEMDHWRQPDV